MILDNTYEIKNSFLITHFYTALDYNWDEFYSFSGEQHDLWEIVYVLSGEVECTEDEKIYILREGEMLFHAPMEFHKIRSGKNSRPHLFVLSFSIDGEMPKALEEGIFYLNREDRKCYEDIFLKICNLDTENKENYFIGQLCSMELSAFLIRLALDKESVSHISNLAGVAEYRRIVNTMQRGVRENLTLEAIAQRCNLSISYMKVLFMRYAGVSPKSYYIKMRYDEALSMLKNGVSIGEVTEKMNFSSTNYFSVFIKKQSGLPPARLMKQK